MTVVDAALLFGGDPLDGPSRDIRDPEPAPVAEAPRPASEPVAAPPQTAAVDLSAVREQLELRLHFINLELERLEALDDERVKIERLLAAIGD